MMISALSRPILYIFIINLLWIDAFVSQGKHTICHPPFAFLDSIPASPRSILTMPFSELITNIGGSGKAKIIWESIRKGENPLDESSSHLSDRAKETLRNILNESPLIANEIVSETPSSCGTRKFLQKLSDGVMVESVLIPAYKFDRTTLCVSTQVGCDRGCAFCATGKMGLIRNLTADEILSQVVHGLRVSAREKLPLMTNIVFMGMGDAGRNLEAVGQAVHALTDRDRFCMAQSKVTVSTVGPSPETFLALAKMPATIAWSLHAAEDGLRRLLVPSTRHSTVELREGLATALATRAALRTRTIMVAATLIEGINDNVHDAKALADFMRPLQSVAPKIALDLIPYNDINIQGFRRPSKERVNAFQDVLREEGFFCSVRVTRGDEEASACGMLATKRVKTMKLSSSGV